MTDRIRSLPIANVYPNPDQPRKHFDRQALEDLANSIKTNGLLQPITVVPQGERYMIIAGERRFRATVMTGATKIQAIVKEGISDQEIAILATMENIARADMNAIEEANALQRLLSFGLTRDEVAERVGTTPAIVLIKTSVLGCIESVQHLVERGQFSAVMAGQLSKLSPNGQQKVLRAYQQKPMTQLEFTQLVNGVHAQESNIEMFPETKVSEESRKAAGDFRRHIDTLTRTGNAIADLDYAAVGEAIGHDAESLAMRIDEAIKVLTRAKAGMRRQAGRQRARMMDAAS